MQWLKNTTHLNIVGVSHTPPRQPHRECGSSVVALCLGRQHHGAQNRSRRSAASFHPLAITTQRAEAAIRSARGATASERKQMPVIVVVSTSGLIITDYLFPAAFKELFDRNRAFQGVGAHIFSLVLHFKCATHFMLILYKILDKLYKMEVWE